MNRRWLIALSQRLVRKTDSESTYVNDGELLQRFREGCDQDAFAELVRRNGPMVWAVCRQLLPNRSDAEDGVQATFLALVQSASRIRNNASPGSWLYGVAVRIATKIKRSAVRRKQREERVARPEGERPNPASDWSDSYALIHEEILTLPEAMRSAFVLCELQNVPSNEAARQLGCSANALAARLSKARRKLMAALAKRGIAPTIVAGLLGIGSVASSAVMPIQLLETVQSLTVTNLPTLPVHIVDLSQEALKMSHFQTKMTATAILTACTLAFGFGISSFANPNSNASFDTPAAVTSSAKEPVREATDKPKTSVTGKVVLPDGKPAAGASVWACQRNFSGPNIRIEATSDRVGKYELKLGEGHWFLFSRSGSMGSVGVPFGGYQELNVNAQSKTAFVDIRLEERGLFKGKLFAAETKKTLAGATLHLDNGDVLTCDANGAFETGGLTRTNHEMFVVAPGRLRQRVLFDTTAQANTELEIPVGQGTKIVGKVTDQNGKAIPGAWVGRLTSGKILSTSSLKQNCNLDGTFEYDGVAIDERLTLTASAPGFEMTSRESIPTLHNQSVPIEFKLNPFTIPNESSTTDKKNVRTVSGIVRAPDGKPLRDVLVRWGYLLASGMLDTRTDTNGRFQLSVPEDSNQLAILPKDYLPVFPEIETRGDKRIDVKLKSGSTVSGTVVDEDGKPIAGVLALTQIPAPNPTVRNSAYGLTESQAITNAEGKFLLKGVPPQARFEFFKSGMNEHQAFDLKTNGVENTITMHYGGAIKGKVVDINGKPIHHFRITVNNPEERKPGDQYGSYSAGFIGNGVRFSSDDGSFVLTNITAKCVYRIHAIAEGHGEAVVDRVIAVPINHLEKTKATVIKAEAPSSLKIKLLDTKGNAITDTIVTLINGNRELDRSFSWGHDGVNWEDKVHMRTNSNGVAEFPSLSFSQGTIVIEAKGKARSRTGWRNREKEREIVLQPESILNATVTFPKESLKQGFGIILIGEDNQQFQTYSSPADNGKFRIDGIPAGKWTIYMSNQARPGLHEIRVSLELKPGENKDWNFAWSVGK